MTMSFESVVEGKPRRIAIAALLTTSALLTPVAAVGQIAPPSTTSSGATVQDPEAHPTAAQPGLPAGTPNDSEIVVTALKRATSVERTPLSITAVSADTLNRQNITDTNALARIAPSLVINENSNGGSRVIIRNLYATGEPLVGLYYDEVPLSGTGGVSNDAGGTLPGIRLFDVERVEVLRGPQGTLYGAS